MIEEVCASCGKRSADSAQGKLLKCSRCLSRFYCSRECQTKDWKAHKLQCTPSTSPTPTSPDPFSLFPPFLSTILPILVQVLQVPHFPDLYAQPPSARRPVLFHLHFQTNKLASTDKLKQFKLIKASQSSLTDFLTWATNRQDMISTVLEQWKFSLSSSEEKDKSARGALTKEERDETQARFRFCFTAENSSGRLIGFKLILTGVPTVTRSALDPANKNLAFFEPLQFVLDQCSEADGNPSDPTQPAAGILLEKIVKAFCASDEKWEERANIAYRKSAAEPKSRSNFEIGKAVMRMGIDEKIILGARRGPALVYAACVPEYPVKCTCGSFHGPAGHPVKDDGEELAEGSSESSEFEFDSDEDGATPPDFHSHGHFLDPPAAHSHSHTHDDHHSHGH